MSHRTPPPTPRGVAVDLLEEVLLRRRLLDEVLESDRHLPRLSERDRGFARLLVATCLRRLGQIDALLGRCLDQALPRKAARVENALRLGVCQLLFLDTPAHAAISTSVELIKHSPLAGYAGLVNAVLRRLDVEGRRWVAAQDAARLNTPDWLWASWTRTYGPELAHAIATTHLSEAAVDITVTGDAAAWAERLGAEPMPTGSLRRRSYGDIARLPGFAEGAWWVQDMAAALPARLMGDVAGRRVADLCAAPGGKALQLAAAGAEVTAVDRSARRLIRFQENIARLGFAVTVVEADAGEWHPGQTFDAVLLDAPCTATGTLRRHPDGLWLKAPVDVVRLAAAQARLLSAALDLVRPGGVLVYCVCSLEPEEGIERIEALLASGAPARRRPIAAAEIGGLAELISPAGDLRTLPCHLVERGGMDAFYAARLERLP
ncbi:MAG: methyltransferase domain-containing protein [Magnetospirillum sp.]|nr:methyltransferase domain-containing protein [Magnetospirillum sp.]